MPARSTRAPRFGRALPSQPPKHWATFASVYIDRFGLDVVSLRLSEVYDPGPGTTASSKKSSAPLSVLDASKSARV